jgi:hypothetical protein
VINPFRNNRGNRAMPLEEDNLTASADGILQCLRVLAEEAATLNLQRTLSAIQDAVETALLESRPASRGQSPLVLH